MSEEEALLELVEKANEGIERDAEGSGMLEAIARKATERLKHEH